MVTRAKHYDLIMEHYDEVCEPYSFEYTDMLTGKVEIKKKSSESIDESKSLMNLVQ